MMGRLRHEMLNTYGHDRRDAAAEKINESYVGRVLRLTLLAPDIVEAVLNGRQPAEMTLAVLVRPFPVGWRQQQTQMLHRTARLPTARACQ